MIVSANKVREGWQLLVEQSPYATFFQTEKAYDFYRSQSYLDTFALAVIENNQVTGVAVGYIQSEKGIKSYFSKRAIITVSYTHLDVYKRQAQKQCTIHSS